VPNVGISRAAKARRFWAGVWVWTTDGDLNELGICTATARHYMSLRWPYPSIVN